MTNSIRTIAAMVAVLCLSVPIRAEEHNFAKGTLIIPMDQFYQSDDDGGILEAYGLVYYLLAHTTGGENDIAVHWIINQDKAAIDAPDFVIEDLTLTEGAVVKRYNHAGGTADLTFNTGDSFRKVTYAGAPFIVENLDAAKAKAIIDQSNWSAVEVHEAQVPFKAPVYRKMRGTPPRIALMNNQEDKSGGGNASILESYLRLAGICTDVYDIVTPNEIRDGILTAGEGYDFLWSPHWTGYGNNSDDDNGNGVPDVEDIVLNVRQYLMNGKSLLAECASIEVFEHSENGQFLSTGGFGHNGGTNDEDTIIYNDVQMPNSQVGHFTYEPEGGHLHNWRPYQVGDDYKLDPEPDEADGNSSYHDTVTRFTIDDTGWDYYVGGHAYGNSDYGYVVYLGGHKYASCGGQVEVDPNPDVHTLKFEFDKDISSETFTLVVTYSSTSSTTVTFSAANLTAHSGNPLEIDFTTATVGGKIIEDVTFRNIGLGDITVNSMTLSWTGGHADQKIKKIENETIDEKLWDHNDPSGTVLNHADYTIATGAGGGSAGCTNNDDCDWTNIAGVRYVLNTLFNVKYQIASHEFVRAAAIVSHPYLFQGSFEYPSYQGHFRRYDVTKDTGDTDAADWDTAGTGHIAAADYRNVYTALKDNNGDWTKVAFSTANAASLRAALDVTPNDGDDADEEAVIHRVRGKHFNAATGQWADKANRLGGIEHSAPVVVSAGSRTGSRSEMAYVGDLNGMLHAIDTASGDEKWAYIPRNLLGKLKNVRTDPNAPQDFAAVDASPTAADVYYDHDNDANTANQWRTILVSPQGVGGRTVFALDITDPDPDDWSVLWEQTVEVLIHYTGTGGLSAGDNVTGATSGATGVVVSDDTAADDLTLKSVTGSFQTGEQVSNGSDTVTAARIVQMGHAHRCSLNKVKWPVRDNNGDITGYAVRHVVYVATGFANIAEDHGGINVFAFDLKTGDRLWYFSESYADSVNDIPGAVTLYDMNGDTFVDRLYVGDMNGRMWELDAVTGANPNGTQTVGGVVKQIPLWNAGVGNPISVSPAIVNVSPVIVIFGTGGTDWAADDRSYYIYAVDATHKAESPTAAAGAGTEYWKIQLPVGEKVWSAPTIADDEAYVATSTGSMESDDPRQDWATGGSNLYALKLKDGTKSWAEPLPINKIRGSVYVDRAHLYVTTLGNEVIQIGDPAALAGSGNDGDVFLKAWRKLNN